MREQAFGLGDLVGVDEDEVEGRQGQQLGPHGRRQAGEGDADTVTQVIETAARATR
ncbi:hypothetical protein GCM10010517_61540 [Streptosporangium fragile]|uniref:Uncharacterized protein n=1 Tax=Streptosporangium fragile TaxID=46186 RepID=A0ABN3W592_9ACTN